MTYETVAAFSQVTTLLMFVSMFLAVLAYALWPSNGAIFDKTQREALDLAKRDGLDFDQSSKASGGPQ